MCLSMDLIVLLALFALISKNLDIGKFLIVNEKSD